MSRRHARSDHGSVMVITAIAMFALLAMMTFAIDVSHWFDYSRNLQNRADAAALAAGAAYGNICFGSSPGDTTSGAQSAIGKWAQLYSGAGVTEPGGNLPYSDTEVSAATNNPTVSGGPGTGWDVGTNGYINNTTNVSPVVSPLTLKLGSLDNYFVRLNADNYAPTGTNFAMGTFCDADPSKDLTDKNPGPPGGITDVKVSQRNLPDFIPLFNIRPNINAHARVEIQEVGSENAVRPLAVRDPASTPCMKVTFVQTNGSDPATPTTQTVQLQYNTAVNSDTGPILWDNTNSGTNPAGDSVQIPTGANLYMQVTLYAQGSDGTCATVGNSKTYEQSSGILYVNSYGTAVPTGTQPPAIVGDAGGGGITLLDNGCGPDQYFSSNETANCSVTACAIVAFTPGNSAHGLTVNGTAMTASTDPNCTTAVAGATAWTAPLTVAPLSGQHKLTLAWSETVAGGVAGGNCDALGDCTGTFGVQQQAFSACDETQNTCTDPNASGDIELARISEGANTTLGSFQGGTSHDLVVQIELQALQDAKPSDRCTTTSTSSTCTVLRFGPGNASGSVDCGTGDSTSAARDAFLNGCPLVTDPACIPNSVQWCGGWTKSLDGSCNNVPTRPATGPVDCVNSNSNGDKIPECVAALIQIGGRNVGQPGDPCHYQNNTGCAVDHWLTDGVIDPADPRIINTFIVFPPDVSNTGQTILPIRQFAGFYVTGWAYQGNAVTCPTTDASGNPSPERNEPAPPGAGSSAIWGHWISYVDPDATGNGKQCQFGQQTFGLCTPVLTR